MLRKSNVMTCCIEGRRSLIAFQIALRLGFPVKSMDRVWQVSLPLQPAHVCCDGRNLIVPLSFPRVVVAQCRTTGPWGEGAWPCSSLLADADIGTKLLRRDFMARRTSLYVTFHDAWEWTPLRDTGVDATVTTYYGYLGLDIRPNREAEA